MLRRKKIGLALSGGGPKGIAHIGVVKELLKNNIPIDYIAGTSMGAFVAGWYAAKRNVDELEQLALTYNGPQMLRLFSDVSLPHALVSGTKIEKFLQNYLGDTTIEELPIPYAAVATDLKNGEPVVLRSGKLVHAIRASISMPLLFKPYEYNGCLLVDGALCNPTPIQPLIDMGAEIVIAVNVYDKYLYSPEKAPGFFEVFNNSIDILCHHLSKDEVEKADIIISPACSDIGWGNLFTKEGSQKVISIGEDAAREQIELIQLVTSKNASPFSIISSYLKKRLFTS
jgi:NTE family protein